MSWQSPEGMEEYLRSTKLCDCENEKLKGKAKEIIKGADTPKEAALKIFHFTREEIPFGQDYPDVKASHTLEKGIGTCHTKSNMQIGLLRAVGIPARCHYVHLPKELIKPNIPEFMYNKISTPLPHPWCECFLDGNWLSCEALLDERLYAAYLQDGLFTKEQIPTIDWNGDTDLVLFTPFFVKDLGTFPAWDDVFMALQEQRVGLPPTNRLFGWFPFFLINRRIRKLREKFDTSSEFREVQKTPG
jgi:transglutaminase-like putative cysteine protease